MSQQFDIFNPEYDSSHSLKKNFYRDDDTGKNIITDYNNNRYETDMFGRKLKSFLPKITGVMTGPQRSKLNLLKSNNHSTSPSNNNTINQEDNIIIKHPKKIINYTPKISRLDGYFCYPRPISRPFFNIPNFQLQEELKKEINKEIFKYYNDEHSKKKMKKDNKFLLSYITNNISECKTEEKDKEKSINYIDNNIEEMKEEYTTKLNSIEKDPKYIALNRFKKKIILNKKKDIKLNDAPIEIKKKYQILHNLVQNNPLKQKSDSMNKAAQKYIYNYIKDKKSGSSFDLEKENKFKKLNFNNICYKRKKNLVIGPDKLNDVCRSKDFAIGRSIKMDFGNFSYEEKEKEKDKMVSLDSNNSGRSKEESKINDSMNFLPKISTNILTNNKSKENLLDKDTAETITHMNRNNTEIIVIDEKIENDDLSFISREKEDKKNNNMKKTKIRTLKFVKKNCEHEKELLEGIENESPREEIIVTQKKNVILKDNGQLYRENLALLKLTNPKKFESIRKKDEYDMKLLIKKLGKSREKLNINNKK